jgi:hypothetical protein
MDIVFRSFGFISPKHLNYLISSLSILSLPDEGYSRNVLCAKNLISTFSFESVSETWEYV